jgi:hypothetical protein
MTEKFWDERMAERQGELDRAATELTQLVKETFKEALHDLGGVALEGESSGGKLRNFATVWPRSGVYFSEQRRRTEALEGK